MGEARKAAAVAASHHYGLNRFAMALSRWDREEAQEIVQQTYLEVIEGRADLLGAADPKAYLFGVARKVAASRHRRRSTWARILRLEISRTTDRGTAPGPDPETAAVADQQAARVRIAMAQLAGRQLEVAALVFGEGLTVEEAGRVVGISIGSARTHYHRAKQKLAGFLEDGDVI